MVQIPWKPAVCTRSEAFCASVALLTSIVNMKKRSWLGMFIHVSPPALYLYALFSSAAVAETE